MVHILWGIFSKMLNLWDKICGGFLGLFQKCRKYSKNITTKYFFSQKTSKNPEYRQNDQNIKNAFDFSNFMVYSHIIVIPTFKKIP